MMQGTCTNNSDSIKLSQFRILGRATRASFRSTRTYCPSPFEHTVDRLTNIPPIAFRTYNVYYNNYLFVNWLLSSHTRAYACVKYCKILPFHSFLCSLSRLTSLLDQGSHFSEVPVHILFGQLVFCCPRIGLRIKKTREFLVILPSRLSIFVQRLSWELEQVLCG